MYTLVFLICTSAGCMTTSIETLFKDRESCEAKAQSIIDLNVALSNRRELPEHKAEYQCLSWNSA